MTPSPFQIPGLFESLRALDYLSVAAATEKATSELDRYVGIRALLVLGRYDEAETRRKGAAFANESLATFLDLQLRVYRRHDLAQTVIAFCALKNLPDVESITGDYHFVLGYLHHLLDEYTQGGRHLRIAVAAYHRAGLAACAAVALFNLSVGSNYLNSRALLAAQVTELRARQRASVPRRAIAAASIRVLPRARAR